MMDESGIKGQRKQEIHDNQNKDQPGGNGNSQSHEEGNSNASSKEPRGPCSPSPLSSTTSASPKTIDQQNVTLKEQKHEAPNSNPTKPSKSPRKKMFSFTKSSSSSNSGSNKAIPSSGAPQSSPQPQQPDLESLLRSSPTLMADARKVDAEVKARLQQSDSSPTNVAQQDLTTTPTKVSSSKSPLSWFSRGTSSSSSSSSSSKKLIKQSQPQTNKAYGFTHLSKFSELDREAQQIVLNNKGRKSGIIEVEFHHDQSQPGESSNIVKPLMSMPPTPAKSEQKLSTDKSSMRNQNRTDGVNTATCTQTHQTKLSTGIESNETTSKSWEIPSPATSSSIPPKSSTTTKVEVAIVQSSSSGFGSSTKPQNSNTPNVNINMMNKIPDDERGRKNDILVRVLPSSSSSGSKSNPPKASTSALSSAPTLSPIIKVTATTTPPTPTSPFSANTSSGISSTIVSSSASVSGCIASTSSKGEWSCPRCTLKNPGWRPICEACYYRKYVQPSASVTAASSSTPAASIGSRAATSSLVQNSTTTTISTSSSSSVRPIPSTSASAPHHSHPPKPSPPTDNFLSQHPTKLNHKMNDNKLQGINKLSGESDTNITRRQVDKRDVDIEMLRHIRLSYFNKEEDEGETTDLASMIRRGSHDLNISSTASNSNPIPPMMNIMVNHSNPPPNEGEERRINTNHQPAPTTQSQLEQDEEDEDDDSFIDKQLLLTATKTQTKQEVPPPKRPPKPQNNNHNSPSYQNVNFAQSPKSQLSQSEPIYQEIPEPEPSSSSSASASHTYENWEDRQLQNSSSAEPLGTAGVGVVVGSSPSNFRLFANPNSSVPNIVPQQQPLVVSAFDPGTAFAHWLNASTRAEESANNSSSGVVPFLNNNPEEEEEEEEDMSRRRSRSRYSMRGDETPPLSYEDYRRLGAIPKGYAYNYPHSEDGTGGGGSRRSGGSGRSRSVSRLREPQDDPDSVAASKLLRKLEWAIAHGEHRLAATLAHDLALLKVNCALTNSTNEQKKKNKVNEPIMIRVYVEDRFMQQGPFYVQVLGSMTLKDLKSKIEGDWGIPAAFQKWIIGKNMAEEDHVRLENYEVAQDTMAFLYLVTPQIESITEKEEEEYNAAKPQLQLQPPPLLPKKKNKEKVKPPQEPQKKQLPKVSSGAQTESTKPPVVIKPTPVVTKKKKPPMPDPPKLEDEERVVENKPNSVSSIPPLPGKNEGVPPKPSTSTTALTPLSSLPTSLQAKLEGLRQTAEQLSKNLHSRRLEQQKPVNSATDLPQSSSSPNPAVVPTPQPVASSSSEPKPGTSKSILLPQPCGSPLPRNEGKQENIYRATVSSPAPDQPSEKILNTHAVPNNVPLLTSTKVEGSCQTTLPFPPRQSPNNNKPGPSGSTRTTPVSSPVPSETRNDNPSNSNQRGNSSSNNNNNTVIIANVLVTPFLNNHVFSNMLLEKLSPPPSPCKSPEPIASVTMETKKTPALSQSITDTVDASPVSPSSKPALDLTTCDALLKPKPFIPPYFVTKKDEQKWKKEEEKKPPMKIAGTSNNVKLIAEKFNKNTSSNNGSPSSSYTRRRNSDTYSLVDASNSGSHPNNNRRDTIAGDGDSALLQMLQMMEKEDLIRNREEFECPICFLVVTPGDGVTLRDCLHNFCRDCLIGAVRYAEDSVVKCPYRDGKYNCASTMQDREIKALVPRDVFESYLARSVKLAEHRMMNTFHCKTPDCTGWCIYEDDVNTFKCPVCRKKNCITCAANHEGMNCHQYQRQLAIMAETDGDARTSRMMLETMIQRGDALECPACHVVLLKKWGCDWVRCTYCKTEICWITKGPRWGPGGKGDISGGCKCGVNGIKCHPKCTYCH